MAFDATTGFYFELFIIGAAAIWDVLTVMKYREKKNPPTLLLFLMFVNWTLAIVFSWLSKYFEAFVYGINNFAPPSDPNAWIINRIMGFRISFIFVTIALYISYYLRVKLFNKAFNRVSNLFHIAFGTTICVLSLFLYNVISADNSIDRIIVFALVMVFMLIVYGPMMTRSLQVGKTPQGAPFNKAFQSIAIMALFFILVFVFFLVDQLIGVITSIGYTPFYFAAWGSAIVGFISAYFGYIRPPAK
jgi:hypothetical protein